MGRVTTHNEEASAYINSLLWQVAALKEMIAKEIPTHPVETQKLVALGKVIDDDEKTLADYKIPDNGIIVLM